MRTLALRKFITTYDPDRLKRMNGKKPAFGIEAAVLNHIDREERKKTGRPPRRIEAIMAYIRNRPKPENQNLKPTVSMKDVPTRKGTPFEDIPPASEEIIKPEKRVISKDALSSRG